MKGMVFVELLRMAEDAMGEEAVDEVMDGCDLASGGAYTATGNYPCSELMALVAAFSEKLNAPQSDLQYAFGRWMLDRFAKNYPAFFADKPDALAMLEAIEAEVHVEVRKLYPDAELPHFDTERIGDGRLMLVYRSPRPLIGFCHGLIAACLEHFEQQGTIDVETRSGGTESEAVFTVSLAA